MVLIAQAVFLLERRQRDKTDKRNWSPYQCLGYRWRG